MVLIYKFSINSEKCKVWAKKIEVFKTVNKYFLCILFKFIDFYFALIFVSSSQSMSSGSSSTSCSSPSTSGEKVNHITTISATSRIIHPTEDLSLVFDFN